MSNIKELIEKFFDGTTTVEEELEMRRILCQEELPAHIEEQKALLLAMLPTESEVPAGLEARLEALIDNLAQEEQTLPCHPKEVAERSLRSTRALLFARCATLAAAAIVALVCLLHPIKERPRDTFSTPEEAAKHINETFAHLAMVVNSGQKNCINTATHLQSIGNTTRSCIATHLK